jgi:hypothetical protein
MAKRMVRALRGGWNDVGNLDFLIGDHYLIDE